MLCGWLCWAWSPGAPTNQQRSPGRRGSSRSELVSPPDWSLMRGHSREISEKHPTPRTNRQAEVSGGGPATGQGTPSRQGAGAGSLQMACRVEGVGSQARSPGPAGRHGRGRRCLPEPLVRLGPRFPAGLAGGFAPRLCSHTLWLDRLVPGGGSGPQTFPQLLAPGCKTLRGPTIRRLRRSSYHPAGSSGGAAGLGPGASLMGSGLETPEDILTSLPFLLPPGL